MTTNAIGDPFTSEYVIRLLLSGPHRLERAPHDEVTRAELARRTRARMGRARRAPGRDVARTCLVAPHGRTAAQYCAAVAQSLLLRGRGAAAVAIIQRKECRCRLIRLYTGPTPPSTGMRSRRGGRRPAQ